MSRCLSCAGPDDFHEPPCQQERASLRAENARLQERVEKLERENTRLQIRAGEAEAQRKEAQTGRENVHAYCATLEAERDALQARVEEAEADRRRAFSLIVSYSDERDEARALAEQRKKALEEYGKHVLGCTFGLLPAGVHRQSFSTKENERLKRASIKECTCGFRAAIEEEEK